MIKLSMKFKNATKTCYRFEQRDEGGNLVTLYLKKADVDKAGIDYQKGIIVTVEENNTMKEEL